jgi:hypothetical protein
MRLHGRRNDNPTPEQCMYIIRKLIVLKCDGLTPSLYIICRELTLDIPNEKIDESILSEILQDLHSLCQNTPSDSQLYHCNDVLWNLKKRIIA